MTFDDFIPALLHLEGGYVNHPNDPGGETKFGISKTAYPHLDIANLTQQQAIQIYKRDYWTPIEQATPDPKLRIMAFDASVNHGLSRALTWLEECPSYDEYVATRIRFYTSLRTFDTFGRGWMNRIAHVMNFLNPTTHTLTIQTIIDHRTYTQRIHHSIKGTSGPARITIRPLTHGDGLKLDIS